MRLVPRRWHNETWICSIRGHVVPAAGAARLSNDNANIGIELDDGTRVSRCLRCDLWLRTRPPGPGVADFDRVPPLTEIDLPRRGKPLEDAILLRLIAIDRGFHAVLFGTLFVVLLVVQLRLPRIRNWAQSIVDGLNATIGESGSSGSHSFLTTKLEALLDIKSGELQVLMVTALAYAVIEGVEGVFLWKERRWAEYLTVVATVGFIPFEIRELIDRVTVLRAGALVVNVAILAWLVWTKHLFGLRGGYKTLEQTIDWDEILSSPTSPARTPTMS